MTASDTRALMSSIRAGEDTEPELKEVVTRVLRSGSDRAGPQIDAEKSRFGTMPTVCQSRELSEQPIASGISNEWPVVDLFCGIGGLSHGFRRAGFDVVAGVDADETCRYAFEANNDSDFIKRSLEDFTCEELRNLYPEGKNRILVGCAPCAPFSAYTPAAKKRLTGKWTLVELFADRIMEVDPDIVSMENVPRLISFESGRIFGEFVRRLEEVYDVTVETVSCTRYGVPQHRKRLVLLASKLGRLRLDDPAHYADRPVTVRDAIGNLPPISHGETHENDRIHVAPKLSELNMKRIRASAPGGTWKDWPEELLAECHRKESGRWYRNVYGRMAWDEPSPTITTGCYGYGRGRFGHPAQDRAISLREAALIQTFPPDYDFVREDEPVYFAQLGRHIGNAVPVALAEAIATSIAKHIEESRS